MKGSKRVVCAWSAWALGSLVAACAENGNEPPDELPPPPPLEATPADAARPAAATPTTDIAVIEDGPRFEDVTTAWGISHVRSPVNTELHETPDFLTSPVCIIDVDGVPPMDLLFGRRAADGGSGAILYVGAEVGRYVDETDARGLGDLPDVYGCVAFDQDADGDQDLLLTGMGHVTLMVNDGGRYSAVDALEGSEFALPFAQYVGAAVGDLDGDHDLDVVVAGNSQWDLEDLATHAPCIPIYCEAETGLLLPLPSLYLQSDGPGKLEERTGPLIPLLQTHKFTLVVGVVDFDGDHLPDIYVGNDFRNDDFVLSRQGNADGAFTNIAVELAVDRNHTGSGLNTMGWSQGDVDGDGILDHIITGFESEQTSVHVSYGDYVLETSPDSGTEDRIDSFRWGGLLGDVDSDGDLDLVEATGHVYTDELLRIVDEFFLPEAPPGFEGPEAQPTNLFLNDGSGRLDAVDLHPDDGLTARTKSRGLAFGDLDDDGRLDLVIANYTGAPQVLRNVGAAGHWLRITLVGSAPNLDAIGARVELTQRGRQQIRYRVAGEGYGGASDPRLHVGFRRGDPVLIEVVWPNGERTQVGPVTVDQALTIRQDD